MSVTLYPWQGDAWAQWRQLRARLPHAILFHGPQGIGKTDFAEACAAALLCETPSADGHACGQCDACGWFAQYSHPDYRRVRPEALEDEAGEGEDGEAGESKKAKTSKPSKEIKIDQVRALGDFMNISTHRSGMRVVLLHPAEALNTAAANSLLKMLEEPPPNTTFLLVSNSLDRLLPTILSRCRKFALSMPAREAALQWLKAQDLSDAEGWLAEQGGAPLAALEASQNDSREAMTVLLQQLAQPAVDAALKTADALQKTPVAALVGWQQRWLYDVLSAKLSGTIRYYPRYRKEIERLATRVETAALLGGIKALGERRAIADHPLAPKLFIEDMLLDYTALFS
ncbi:DNA polymerase III subunit delta' [Oxalicibacterium flavum]|uniref:DNA polymerase III subunit delta n=1 Tax=Oxalicibacterium flavum TaxID=179467 RepID=A0A8J2XUU7_9BURK|nr:DNA polymerase III subunit delta' [Oxalicibacterium flavum]GGC02261.1 DNA polymerase III subunit delta' [Oxalicibacterium flavum]